MVKFFNVLRTKFVAMLSTNQFIYRNKLWLYVFKAKPPNKFFLHGTVLRLLTILFHVEDQLNKQVLSCLHRKTQLFFISGFSMIILDISKYPVT